MNLKQLNDLVIDLNKHSKEYDFILIQGIPGSGKSTLASILSHIFGSEYYEADQYFERLGHFDASKLSEAHFWCQEMVRAQIFLERCPIVSNTSLTDWELEPYIKMGKPYIIRMKTEFGSIHNIPEHTMKKMRSKTCSIKPNFIVQ